MLQSVPAQWRGNREFSVVQRVAERHVPTFVGIVERVASHAAAGLDEEALVRALAERDVQLVIQQVEVALSHARTRWRAAEPDPIVRAYVAVMADAANETRCLVQPTTSRRDRALATYKPAKASKQRAAEANEAWLAAQLRGQQTGDNRPMDVVVEIEGRWHGVEVKTMFDNTRDQIRVGRDQAARKVRWQRETKGVVHTVVVDERWKTLPESFSGSRLWYQRGAASFRLRGMIPADSPDDLRRLMTMTGRELKQEHAKRWKALLAGRK